MKKILLGCVALVCLLSFTYGQKKDSGNSRSEYTKIIQDLDKIVNPDGVQENYEVAIGGIKQWVFVRGQARDNPIILFVHGGPASPLSPVMWAFQRPIEEYFTVVQYDQRAAGKTYLTNDTLALGKTMNIGQYVDDAIELTEFIRKKYKKRKVILIGHSWGTIVSMKAALRRPDLFYAYIGIGQIINTKTNERLSYEYAIKEATKLKNDSALRELMSIAPYPGNKPVTRERIIIARKWPQYYGGLTAFRNNSFYFFNAPLLSPEYSSDDIDAIGKGSLFTLGRILPEFLNVNFENVKKFPIPIFMFMGRHDYTTPSGPTDLWLRNVEAPFKKGIWFENSAHLIPLEEPGKMLISLVEYVRPISLK
ncbi:MAG TPA: alpha/beta hydrolase [Puia sp.]|nr:alpha/beta hydrolase [Puia sp.]